ncbi:MAG: hypothetical protein HN825_03030 [Gammaproteobacteria bacterium]|jgi:hypothetical protein|nr:hypothetical protein [Gammaproteobacteria bacterium]MBT5743296.1 hypothetical protein [Gammaproteobacteria bacterium]MBT7384884.1 hypothetical protein [Gammaproteobacteria bacterium]
MSQFPVIGKPLIVFNEEQIGKVEELAAVLTKTQIADYMGVCANTFRAEERQPEVARAFRAGKSRAIADVATNLIAQALEGNTTAAMFYLRTQAGWTENSYNEISPTQHVIQIIRPLS